MPALELVRKARAKDTKPPWRIVHLEAQIQLWRLQDARRRAGPEAKQILAEMDELFWTDATGALPRLQIADCMTSLSSWDVEGILETPLIALEAMRDPQGQRSDNASKARTIVEAYLTFCQKKAATNEPGFPRRLLIERSTQVVSQSMPLWSHMDAARWSAALDQLQELFQLDSPAATAAPPVYADFAYLLMAQKKVQPEAAKQLDQRIDRFAAPS